MDYVDVSVPFRGFRGLQDVNQNGSCLCMVRVSVPFRGFRGLQAGRHVRNCRVAERVSVPFRGFRGLQGGEIVTAREAVLARFSPLPGF